MSSYHAKKRLGQNFLKSDSVIKNIIDVINPKSNDKIIEIGPGRGALTMPLADSKAEIIAVEFDRDLIGYLNKLFEKYDNVKIINDDFLKYKPEITGYKLVGNLPYNLSSPVLEWVTINRESIKSAFLMVQREVAQRIASSHGSKDWSPLAIFIQLYFDISACFDIPPEHFQPIPQVTSQLIKLSPKVEIDVKDFAAFERVVRQSFTRRRKTLLNNLVPKIIPDAATADMIFTKLEFVNKCRAEQISIEQFLKLTNQLISDKLI